MSPAPAATSTPTVTEAAPRLVAMAPALTQEETTRQAVQLAVRVLRVLLRKLGAAALLKGEDNLEEVIWETTILAAEHDDTSFSSCAQTPSTDTTHGSSDDGAE